MRADLDRRIVPTWARPKPRRRHRAPGPARMPLALEILVGILVVRWVLP